MHKPLPPLFQSRRALVLGIAGWPLAAPVRAQRPSRPARVAWLGWTSAEGLQASAQALASFRSGLTDRGWVEGRDLHVFVREGDRPRAGDLTFELMAHDPDVVVAVGPMVFGAKSVTGTKPLVFCINGDPVEAKLVTSLPRPGGTLTGVTALSTELAGKRLELLKEATRSATRVAVIANEIHPGVAIERDAIHASAVRLGLKISWYGLKAPGDLDAALAAVAREGADGIVAVPDNLVNRLAQPIAQFAQGRRLPTISGWDEFAEAGNTMSYGPSRHGYFRQMAFLADRLLRGARAAELAVEQPRELEFVLNLRSARAIQLELPAQLLLRADRQIT
ncbi:ABC transporter substrate-binding protein [Pseudorhodoferax sp.]|uniref:ABC transporter substrate-binding protein n=1 Tax=Pseudorhodoferax sp. TaxID=1993553 RepID=UPI002DD6B48D|nr:ABC transporter substrate-binding protein [Pseudorhodoferax sp.]